MELTETDSYCPGDQCNVYAHGYEEFCGYCPECWKALDPEERAVLQGNEPPVKEVVTHTQVTTHYPPKPWFGWRILAVTWQVTITAAVLWLAWRVMSH